MNHTNQEVAQSYKAPSNHKMLFTNLGIGFGTFCILACIIKIYKVCYIKQTRNRSKTINIPKKEKYHSKTIDISKKERNHSKTIDISQLEFKKNPLNDYNNPDNDWELVDPIKK